jgi:Tfp pilus assembly protein PilO
MSPHVIVLCTAHQFLIRLQQTQEEDAKTQANDQVLYKAFQKSAINGGCLKNVRATVKNRKQKSGKVHANTGMPTQ